MLFTSIMQNQVFLMAVLLDWQVKILVQLAICFDFQFVRKAFIPQLFFVLQLASIRFISTLVFIVLKELSVLFLIFPSPAFPF